MVGGTLGIIESKILGNFVFTFPHGLILSSFVAAETKARSRLLGLRTTCNVGVKY